MIEKKIKINVYNKMILEKKILFFLNHLDCIYICPARLLLFPQGCFKNPVAPLLKFQHFEMSSASSGNTFFVYIFLQIWLFFLKLQQMVKRRSGNLAD